MNDPLPAEAPLPQDELERRWARTLGRDADWARVDPQVTQKPVESGGTLSQVATFGAGNPPSSTPPSGGGSTLSGGGTVANSSATGGDAANRATTGGYELVGELGRGGMGVVYRARQRTLAREIALKFIRPEHRDPGARERFVSEALVNGLLDHPNIVPVHELGTTGEGEVFLAMKLVGGRSWKALLHPQTADERAAAAGYDLDKHLAVLGGVGNAIAFAHSRGIVHRDLKPENVMVGEFGEVLVMDWGIAVDVRDAPDGDQRAQHKSTITAPSGTPSYMAPELAEGRGKDIGPWTDVYLLGAILHEVLTGQPPHRGRTLMAVLLAAAASAPPTWPAGVPAGLAAIAEQAMRRDPRERFATVAEFQAAIARYLKHRESEAIATAAGARLAAAEGMTDAGSNGGGAARNRRYGAFAEAVAGYRQALVLWDGNAAATAGERAARLAYARAALTGGDLGLAEAQLEPLAAGEDDGLAGRIAAARAAAVAHQRAARRNRWLLAGATGAIVVGLGVGSALLNAERARTASERDRAVASERLAKEQEALATSERDRAQEAERQARAAQAATERAQVAIRRRAALNAASEAGHADATGDDGLGLLWMGEALDRDVTGGVEEEAWRLAIGGRLLGLPAPLAGGGASEALTAGDRDARVYVEQVAATSPREPLLLLMQHLRTGQDTTSILATWDPLRGGPATPVASVDGCGWAVAPDRRTVVLTVHRRPWPVYRRGADGRWTQTAAVANDHFSSTALFTPDGRHLALVDSAGLRVLRTDDLSPVAAIALDDADSNRELRLSLDGGWLLASERGRLRMVELGTWHATALPAIDNTALLAVLPGGRWAMALPDATRATARDTRVHWLRRDGDDWVPGEARGDLLQPHQVRDKGGAGKPRAVTYSGGAALALELRDAIGIDRFIFTDAGDHLDVASTFRYITHRTLEQRLYDLLPLSVQGVFDDQPPLEERAGRVQVDRAAGIAVLCNASGALTAFDLNQPVVTATVTRLPRGDAGAAPTTIQQVPMVLAYNDGLYTDRDLRFDAMPATIPGPGGLEHASAAGLVDGYAVAHDGGVAVYLHLPAAGGAPRRVDLPWPEYPGCAPGGRVAGSAGGTAFAIIRPLTAGGAVAWTALAAAPTVLRGPRLIGGGAGATAIPGDDGAAVLRDDGLVVAMAGGAARPWQAGDPLPVQVGDAPVHVPRQLSLACATYARDAGSGRMRALRSAKFVAGDEASVGYVWVDEYTGREAVGTVARRSRTIALPLVGGDTLPPADLSPDGRWVLVWQQYADRIALHDAADMHLLATYAFGDLLGEDAVRAFGKVGSVSWGQGGRIRITSQQDDVPVALVALPRIDGPPAVLNRWLGAFSQRRLDDTGSIVELTANSADAAVQARPGR